MQTNWQESEWGGRAQGLVRGTQESSAFAIDYQVGLTERKYPKRVTPRLLANLDSYRIA
jgi:hypothetical protein